MTLETAPRPTPFPDDVSALKSEPVEIDLPVAAVDRYQRECDLLACRLHEAHPGVPLPTILDLVDTASGDLAGARVQAFRLILVERAVRRRLSDPRRGTSTHVQEDEEAELLSIRQDEEAAARR